MTRSNQDLVESQALKGRGWIEKIINFKNKKQMKQMTTAFLAAALVAFASGTTLRTHLGAKLDSQLGAGENVVKMEYNKCWDECDVFSEDCNAKCDEVFWITLDAFGMRDCYEQEGWCFDNCWETWASDESFNYDACENECWNFVEMCNA